MEKLPKMPLGTILDTSSGQMKQVIVDQVESMERPLAHLLPEMTANVLGPVCILIYLFVLCLLYTSRAVKGRSMANTKWAAKCRCSAGEG